MFFDYILTAFALIFVIEGMLYAVFPDQMRRMLMLVLAMPTESLRRFGMAMVLCGFLLVGALRLIG